MLHDRASNTRVPCAARARLPRAFVQEREARRRHVPRDATETKRPAERLLRPAVSSGHFVEREKRFELSTSTLARLHSTAELLPQKLRHLLSSRGVACQADILSFRQPSPPLTPW